MRFGVTIFCQILKLIATRIMCFSNMAGMGVRLEFEIFEDNTMGL
jgi:hypothetical protein